MGYKNYMQISEDFVIRKIGDETTIIPLVRESGKNACLYTLNETATTILDGIKKGQTKKEILKGMKNLYPGVDSNRLQKDIAGNIEDLKSMGLLT